jgi:hypothetical protein
MSRQEERDLFQQRRTTFARPSRQGSLKTSLSNEDQLSDEEKNHPEEHLTVK